MADSSSDILMTVHPGLNESVDVNWPNLYVDDAIPKNTAIQPPLITTVNPSGTAPVGDFWKLTGDSFFDALKSMAVQTPTIQTSLAQNSTDAATTAKPATIPIIPFVIFGVVVYVIYRIFFK